MPVEVTARLLRKGGVYLAGETVECEVLVQNKSERREDGGCDSLAWCSVQLHCQEVLNNQKVRVSRALEDHQRNSLSGQHGSTSFAPARGENGFTIFGSRPVILCCDLELMPGEVKRYMYRESLPVDDIPPSFKGQAVKYLYKLTVGVQHLHSPVKLLRLPLRVLVLTGLSHVCLDDNGLSPSNPFLHSQQNKATTLDIANQVIENITAIKNCHIYNVTNSSGKVGQLTLFKNCFKLGEDVLGRFDFSDSEIPCVQCCVSLQTEEEVSEEYRSELKIPIPLSVTPTFFTDIVHLKWRLHFEFVTSLTPLPSDGEMPEESGRSSTWEAPSEMRIETTVWDLPIKGSFLNYLRFWNVIYCIQVFVEKGGLPTQPPQRLSRGLPSGQGQHHFSLTDTHSSINVH